MHIASPAFPSNTMMPREYSCDGKGVNPPLTFSEVPENTKSFALIVDDPDAPTGIFVHWVLYNISPQIIGIAENSIPNEAKQGLTSLKTPGFVAACPPYGQHRYFFKLYALDIVLPEDKSMNKEALEEKMKGHTLAEVELVGLYSRS